MPEPPVAIEKEAGGAWRMRAALLVVWALASFGVAFFARDLDQVLAALTDRECQVVRLMAQRLSNREIAEKLFLSEGSVKQYVNQIYSKLHIEGDTRTKRQRLAELLR